MESMAICDDCRTVWRESRLTELDDDSDRFDPEEEIPAGECPECGGLAYIVDKDDVFTDEEQLKMKINK